MRNLGLVVEVNSSISIKLEQVWSSWHWLETCNRVRLGPE